MLKKSPINVLEEFEKKKKETCRLHMIATLALNKQFLRKTLNPICRSGSFQKR
jgi:hypothetical protein